MRAFRIQIAGEDGSSFGCESNDTILSGALRSRVGLPYECNSGGCGSCQFELLEGELLDKWDEAPGLSARARERGRRLACQSMPTSDCVIRASTNARNIPPIIPWRQSARLVEVRHLTQDMAEFCFLSNEAADFMPGQYAMLQLPGMNSLRAYSMSNLPNEAGEWHFIIKQVPGGEATNVLFDELSSGSEVLLDVPYGNGYLRSDTRRDIVCVAGGSGVSPILSILRAAVRDPHLEGRQFHFFYGGRGPQDLRVLSVIADDPLLSERVVMHTAISDDKAPDASQWEGERGFIHELVRKELDAGLTEFDYYFCGPPAMTDAVQRMLLIDHRVPGGQLYFDRFY